MEEQHASRRRVRRSLSPPQARLRRRDHLLPRVLDGLHPRHPCRCRWHRHGRLRGRCGRPIRISKSARRRAGPRACGLLVWQALLAISFDSDVDLGIYPHLLLEMRTVACGACAEAVAERIAGGRRSDVAVMDFYSHPSEAALEPARRVDGVLGVVAVSRMLSYACLITPGCSAVREKEIPCGSKVWPDTSNLSSDEERDAESEEEGLS